VYDKKALTSSCVYTEDTAPVKYDSKYGNKDINAEKLKEKNEESRLKNLFKADNKVNDAND
jgi:hypothetical protein